MSYANMTAGCGSRGGRASLLRDATVSQRTARSMSGKPIVAAIDMGYGHLRPAAALADHLGTQVLQMDRPPLGDGRDLEFWERARDLYEPLTRFSQLPGLGPWMRAVLNTITASPSPWPP